MSTGCRRLFIYSWIKTCFLLQANLIAACQSLNLMKMKWSKMVGFWPCLFLSWVIFSSVVIICVSYRIIDHHSGWPKEPPLVRFLFLAGFAQQKTLFLASFQCNMQCLPCISVLCAKKQQLFFEHLAPKIRFFCGQGGTGWHVWSLMWCLMLGEWRMVYFKYWDRKRGFNSCFLSVE